MGFRNWSVSLTRGTIYSHAQIRFLTAFRKFGKDGLEHKGKKRYIQVADTCHTCL